MSYVCVYDNPETYHREAWADGRLVASHSADFMASKDWDAYARSGRMPWMLNAADPFTPGTVIYGDARAMQPPEDKPT